MDIYKPKDSEEKCWAPTLCTIAVKEARPQFKSFGIRGNISNIYLESSKAFGELFYYFSSTMFVQSVRYLPDNWGLEGFPACHLVLYNSGETKIPAVIT